MLNQTDMGRHLQYTEAEKEVIDLCSDQMSNEMSSEPFTAWSDFGLHSQF